MDTLLTKKIEKDGQLFLLKFVSLTVFQISFLWSVAFVA